MPVQARVRARHLRSERARGGGEESARRTQAANTRRLAWPAANAASRMPPRALPHLADHGHRNDLHGAAAAAHGDGEELRGQEEGRALRARAAGRRCRAARAGARFGASEPEGGCCRRAPCRCSGHSCRRPSSGSAPSPGSAAPASPSLRRRARALKGGSSVRARAAAVCEEERGHAEAAPHRQRRAETGTAEQTASSGTSSEESATLARCNAKAAQMKPRCASRRTRASRGPKAAARARSIHLSPPLTF